MKVETMSGSLLLKVLSLICCFIFCPLYQECLCFSMLLNSITSFKFYKQSLVASVCDIFIFSHIDFESWFLSLGFWFFLVVVKEMQYICYWGSLYVASAIPPSFSLRNWKGYKAIFLWIVTNRVGLQSKVGRRKVENEMNKLLASLHARCVVKDITKWRLLLEICMLPGKFNK